MTNSITINVSTSISIINKNKVKKITRKKIIIISFKKLIFGLELSMNCKSNCCRCCDIHAQV